ncbi:hypothetical protein [Xanthomonas citri]|uniref:hypothetical protein n=1 Tax=Xanthomonas citri TaxID=346 RepID=UPI00103C7890|nr:hypothetical protein [Xanthomonas citri]MCC8492323.1 hypothetical protein [Xanthomonas citri pv. fuscans]TBW96707.1 hypothetical protein TP49_11860 [Xanthomonas citri pv. aurantifolii]TBX03218.1 hypothetical protein TP46_12355 [Xanthomonas citri pv. aurantifolii]
MTRSYSAFGWLLATVIVLAAIGGFAYYRNADLIGSTLTTIAFLLALHIPQSYRNARRKAAQARTAPMVRPNLPNFPEQPRRGVR